MNYHTKPTQTLELVVLQIIWNHLISDQLLLTDQRSTLSCFTYIKLLFFWFRLTKQMFFLNFFSVNCVSHLLLHNELQVPFFHKKCHLLHLYVILCLPAVWFYFVSADGALILENVYLCTLFSEGFRSQNHKSSILVCN